MEEDDAGMSVVAVQGSEVGVPVLVMQVGEVAFSELVPLNGVGAAASSEVGVGGASSAVATYDESEVESDVGTDITIATTDLGSAVSGNTATDIRRIEVRELGAVRGTQWMDPV
ncbi:hypothetical protein HK101_008444 [Irineochytrium annulatum]|nr:hypothetical protein HK101_008444 [Irineochytrium annulatum]